MKGEKEYASFLGENNSPDVMIWDVKGVPGEARAAAAAKR